jgi:ferritin-like protein
LEANQAVSFFIKVEEFRDADSAQSLTLENDKTQEKLVIKIKAKYQSHNYVTISRYPMGTIEEEWMNEMNQHANIDIRKIEFDQNPY